MSKYFEWTYEDINYNPGDIIRIKSIPGSRCIVESVDGCFVRVLGNRVPNESFPFFRSEIEFHEDQLANIRQKTIDLILDGKS